MQRLPHRMTARIAALGVVAVIATGCTYDDDCYSCSIPVFHEVEPNNSVLQPNDLGFIGPGDHVRIRGHVSDFGPDLFDGFLFTTAVPCDVEVVLSIDNPFADLDLCVYDPLFGGYTFCFETPYNPETGLFSVFNSFEDFHLVVESYVGDSSYTLDVYGHPLSFPLQAGDESRRMQASPALAAMPADPARAEGRDLYFRDSEQEDPGLEVVPVFPGVLIEIDEEGETRETRVRLREPSGA